MCNVCVMCVRRLYVVCVSALDQKVVADSFIPVALDLECDMLKSVT